MTRVAIVTGAAGALGSAICRVLRDASIDVVGVDITGDADVTADVSTARARRRWSPRQSSATGGWTSWC